MVDPCINHLLYITSAWVGYINSVVQYHRGMRLKIIAVAIVLILLGITIISYSTQYREKELDRIDYESYEVDPLEHIEKPSRVDQQINAIEEIEDRSDRIFLVGALFMIVGTILIIMGIIIRSKKI